MNAKKVKAVIESNIKIKNVSVSLNTKEILNYDDINMSGYELVKDYVQLLINSYNIICTAIKTNADETRIPTFVTSIKNKSDLYLIYNCISLLFENYPKKSFTIEKYKNNKKSHFFIYKVNKKTKKNKECYLLYNYDERAPMDKFWVYIFDDKKEMTTFIKDEL